MSAYTPYLESLLAAGFAGLAFWLGRWSSRLPGRFFFLAFFLPFSVIVLYCLALFEPRLSLVPPVSWMMLGRSRFVSLNFAAVLMLSAPMARLAQKRTRVAVRILMVVLSAMSVLPYLAPAFNRTYLAGIQTRLDADGVCRQSNDYTCGPAAAVTLLRKLGFPAEEGELAILAHTSSIMGTDLDVLADEVKKRYAADGLRVEYRAFRNLDELRQAGPTLAVVQFNAIEDHCVAILGVESNHVVLGDPLSGLSVLPAAEFESKWHFVGIVFSRTFGPNPHAGKIERK